MERFQGSGPRRAGRQYKPRCCYRDAAGIGSQTGTGTFSTSVQQEPMSHRGADRAALRDGPVPSSLVPIFSCMKADWFWTHSAAEYTRLHEEINRRVQALPVQPVVGESALLR